MKDHTRFEMPGGGAMANRSLAKSGAALELEMGRWDFPWDFMTVSWQTELQSLLGFW